MLRPLAPMPAEPAGASSTAATRPVDKPGALRCARERRRATPADRRRSSSCSARKGPIASNWCSGTARASVSSSSGWRTARDRASSASPKTSSNPLAPARAPELTQSKTFGNICANWRANRVFETYGTSSSTPACDAWRRLIVTITPIGMRDRGARFGQPS